MKPRKNTVNNLTDMRDPARLRANTSPGSVRRSRSSFPVLMLRRLATLLRNSSRRIGKRAATVESPEEVDMPLPEMSNQITGDASEASQTVAVASNNPAEPEPVDSTSRPQQRRWSNGVAKLLHLVRRTLGRSFAQFFASLTFYTLLPIPFPQRHEFHRIARFAPWVGLLLGLGLGIADWGLATLGMNAGLRTVIVVVSWLGLTGGLHMDGAMDSADGLAVMDPKRRLAVMSDSVTGAFGVMVAMSLLLLKFAALMALPVDPVSRTVVLMAVMGWGRWGQVLAIDRYVYLKVEGKGAFHKRQLRSPEDLWPGLIGLLGLSALLIWIFPERWMLAVGMVLGGFAIAFGTGAWFDRQLGGHTGDTYGAVVEWTEALLLCLLTLL